MGEAKRRAACERHNAAARPILAEIIRRIGGEPADLLVFAESLVVGLFLLIVRLGGDEPVVDVFAERLRTRLAEMRLGNIDPDGHA